VAETTRQKLSEEPVERVPVLIAEGGPVSLALALELEHHGVEALLIERNPTTTQHPKLDITNARTMELFRQLGVAGLLRKVAVPADHRMAVSWVTKLTGWELHRFERECPVRGRAVRADRLSQRRDTPARSDDVGLPGPPRTGATAIAVA
jgi:2-polyprenyl-6-methoxyphenol hydroxylase-like FAD-dependent oxidoreductase